MVQPHAQCLSIWTKSQFYSQKYADRWCQMGEQRFTSGYATRPWLRSISWVHPAPAPLAGQNIPFTRARADYPQQKLWYADSLIWLVAGIKTMQCTNAGLYQGADKTRGIEQQAAGKGLAKGRHPPRGKHRKAEGGCFVLKIATYALFYWFCAEWGPEEQWEPSASQGTRPG